MSRIFTYVRTNRLLGKVLMSNYIHDEGLYEINCEELNVNEVLGNIINCQQVQIKGFPPLTVGAGIGKSWASAKGGMAEIHPLLGNQIMASGASVDPGHTPKEVYDYYEKLNENFRKGRIAQYILEEQAKVNAGEAVTEINPIMAKLMTLAFDNGVEAAMQAEAKELGLDAAKTEKFMTNLDVNRLRKFIELNPEMFGDTQITWLDNITIDKQSIIEEEEDVGYDDDEDDDGDEFTEYEFAMIDESGSMYGLNIIDIIEMFGMVVSRDRGICGIDSRRYSEKQLESIAKLLEKHTCNPEDEGAMQFIILGRNKKLLKPGIYVNGIAGHDIEAAGKAG